LALAVAKDLVDLAVMKRQDTATHEAVTSWCSIKKTRLGIHQNIGEEIEHALM